MLLLAIAVAVTLGSISTTVIFCIFITDPVYNFAAEHSG